MNEERERAVSQHSACIQQYHAFTLKVTYKVLTNEHLYMKFKQFITQGLY